MKTNSPHQTLSYSVIYEADPDGGYVVSVPALPGCHTQGDSLEAAATNIQEAIKLYIEELEDSGESAPHELQVLQGRVEVKV